MRVIVWQELFGPYIGGIELVHQADLPFRRGHEVVVATRQDSPDLRREVQYHGIPIHRYPFAWGAFTNGNGRFAEARKQLSDTKTFNFAHKQAG